MTPTREQLQSIEWASEDPFGRVCPACGYATHEPDCWLAACLAAPPQATPEPQAMPPIEIGDVVRLDYGDTFEVTEPGDLDRAAVTRIYRDPLWTREPRR